MSDAQPGPVLAVLPMQWGILPELADAPPLDEGDIACMEEVRAVLARHGKLRRFALHLAHRHFALEAGEVLIERPDPAGRSQHVSVAMLADHPDAVPTTWLMDDGPALLLSDAVHCVCVSTNMSYGACVRHGKSKSPNGPGAIEHGKQKERERINREDGIARDRPVAGHGEPERER